LSIVLPRCQWPAVELHQRILARGRDFVGKLVRDGIPSIIRSAERVADVRALDTDDFRAALGDKLVEEVAELRAAGDADAVVEEAADVLEILLAIVAEHGATLDSIVDIARRKRVERGGFTMRVWLENADQAPTVP
jgi:predicted house-cleaning noncanonical NTP pyrophosphatase (MazG superfamily)